MSDRSNPGPIVSLCIGTLCSGMLACGEYPQEPPASLVPRSAARSLDRGAAPAVYRVGSWRGRAGTHATIQAAVDAAAPGDWILIGPGDYHEQGAPTAGVLITTPDLHLRGMARNDVIVDGTRAGAVPCSADPADQVGTAQGRNGIEVLKVDGVAIENLTACNFLDDGHGNNGNQIWWNGGDNSGQIGIGPFHGDHLTASSTYAAAATGTYGIFVSNSRGPGVIEHAYASNMSDSGFYVGACPDCNTVLRSVHAQNSAQGFSGTNSGGHLILEDSEWDHNRVGITHTTLASDDPPSPQDGACPDDPGRSCTIVRRNHIHDNNNPNTPGVGIAAAVPVGTGLLISGGRHDLVRDNLIDHNGAWGVLLNDYPDPSTDMIPGYCQGGTRDFMPPPPYNLLLGASVPCYYRAFGTEVTANLLIGNGGFGNLTNSDLANATLPYATDNCFHGNLALTSAPLNIQSPSVLGECGRDNPGHLVQDVLLFTQVVCDAYGPASGACGLSNYPRPSHVELLPIPSLPGLADPCAGAPDNPWCS